MVCGEGTARQSGLLLRVLAYIYILTGGDDAVNEKKKERKNSKNKFVVVVGEERMNEEEELRTEKPSMHTCTF